MLNAKEKALDLYEKMWDVYQHDPVAQECALICVDELLEITDAIGNWRNKKLPFWLTVYLEEVKNQINLL
jgi:hypothetical protein